MSGHRHGDRRRCGGLDPTVEPSAEMPRSEPPKETVVMATTQLAPAPTTRPVRQYGLAGILGTWAAAALPMGALAWVVTPWLAHRFEGPTALPRALILLLTAGLIWQFLLVLILVHREQGSLRWP